MRALTILQPYAHLIVSRPEQLEALADTAFGCDLVEAGVSLTPKRVENRSQLMMDSGELLIHAGVGHCFISPWKSSDRELADLSVGAMVGVVTLAGNFRCVENRHISGDYVPPAWAARRWPWLRRHPHVFGPCCLVLENVRRFRTPVPWRGKQGLWNPETWDSTPGRLAELRTAIGTAEAIEWQP